MIEFHKAKAEEIEILMKIRQEMLRIVNKLPADIDFDKLLLESARDYFLNGKQTTVLAMDGKKAVACASVSYINVMPTYDHPTGKRAHIMNVYTNKDYRRQGIGKKMLEMLIEEARSKGCTEISLDATEEGRFLYTKMGFKTNECAMVL